MGRALTKTPTRVSERQKIKARCSWASREPLISYHDTEWGTREHDDRKLFEFLILEGAQAGLSWETILRKRDAYRKAFDRFDPKKVARYTAGDVARLMKDAGIVRNRAKIASAIGNAKSFLEIQTEHGSFDAYLAPFSDPEALSKDLRKRGMRFVGPTIVESFLEATGRLDHHEPGCYRRLAAASLHVQQERSSRRIDGAALLAGEERGPRRRREREGGSL